MVIFNWIIAILLIVCSICGLKIAIDRRMSSVLNVCYFILLFFFLTIPLLSEGKVLLTIGEFVENKNIDKIETTCKQHRDVIEKEVSSPIARNFFLLAHRFDTISEEILDSQMCTEMCPCLDYNVTVNGQHIVNSKNQYDLLLEKHMNIYKRTNFNETWSTSKGNSPMIWTKDTSKGFKTIKDCYNTTNYVQPYPVNLTSDPSSHYDQEDWDANKTVFDSYIYQNKIYFEMYQKYEDRYNCSGMCQSGLFYYANPIIYGPPSETCLRKMMHQIKENAIPFANSCIVTGSLCILLCLISLALYYRPMPNNNDSSSNSQNPFFKLFSWSNNHQNSGDRGQQY